MKVRLLIAALAAFALIAITVGGATAGNNPAKSETLTADCINSLTGQKEGTFTYTGPTTVWPPNHKYVTATISLTDEDAEPATDDATVSVTGTHDQILEDGSEMNGSGNTDPATDVVPGPPGAGNPTATTTVSFRAERSGHKMDGSTPWRGRTYTFTVNGTTDGPTAQKCDPVEFTANVPHDQRNEQADDAGVKTAAAVAKRTAAAKAQAKANAARAR